jgi:hypothetical protein
VRLLHCDDLRSPADMAFTASLAEPEPRREIATAIVMAVGEASASQA